MCKTRHVMSGCKTVASVHFLFHRLGFCIKKIAWFLLSVLPVTGSCASAGAQSSGSSSEAIPGPDSVFLQSKYLSKGSNIPSSWARPFIVALQYFPELKDVAIKVKSKKTKTLFSTHPTLGSLLKRKANRRYIVTISNQSLAVLQPLMMNNLPYEAQVGVMAHELSHISDFNKRNFFGLMRVASGNLSTRYLDRYEYQTDLIAIEHGAGYCLLAWSSFIRKTMNRENWTGSASINRGPMLRERYMNPETIKMHLCKLPIYQGITGK